MAEHDHGDHGHDHGPGGHAHPHLPPPRAASRPRSSSSANASGTADTPPHAHDAAGGHLTDHADQGGHGHDHGPGGAHHGHTHGAVDPSLLATQQGIHAVKVSFVAMFITSVLQLALVMATGSVALLADTIHNFGDAMTAAPLWLAFALGARPPSRRFTYGFGRAEDLAGVVVVGIILFSAIAAAWESIDRLLHPAPIEHVWVVAVAGLVGFAGNELVAVYRIRTGKAIGSAALVADGYHARADGFTSLAVVLGALGVAAGFPLADPLIGLAITVAILRIVWQAGGQVLSRLMDGVDTEVVDEILAAVRTAPGVVDVSDVRVRWLGHRLRAEVNLAVPATMTVAEAHAVGQEAEHLLLHKLQYLSAAVVHIDPADHSGETYHRPGEHQHGAEPLHLHG